MSDASRAAALSAAVGVIAASRYKLMLPEAAGPEEFTTAELFAAVAAIGGLLAEYTDDGDRTLGRIGSITGLIASGKPPGTPS